MSGTNTKSPVRTINDVLRAIDDAKSTQYKDKDGLAYSSVPVRQLNRWALTLETEQNDGRIFSEGAKDDLKEALAEVQKLTDAATRHEKVVDNLKDGIATAKANHLLAEESLGKVIDGLRKQVKEAKEGKAEAEAVKAETTASLKTAEAALTSPDATFLPEAAVKLRQEIKALKEDIVAADNAIAHERAASSAASKQLDVVQKELAAARNAESTAIGKLATFERQNKGAAAGIKELFKQDDIDQDALIRVIGKAGVAKLRVVLSLDPTDLKGRLSKMVSLLNTSIKAATAGFAAYLKQLLGLINRTLQMIKNNGGSWVAVLSPWINGIIKDVAMLSTKSVSEYRKDLELRMAAASRLPKNASIKEKVRVGNNAAAPQLPWKEVASRNASSTRDFVKRMRQRFAVASSKSAAYAKRIGKFTARVFKGWGLFGWWTVRGTYRTVKRGVVWWYKACWDLGFDAACWFNDVKPTPTYAEKGKAVGKMFRSPYKGSYSYTEADVLDPLFMPRPPTGASMDVEEYEDFRNSFVPEDDLARDIENNVVQPVEGIVMFDADAPLRNVEPIAEQPIVQLPGTIEPGPSYARVIQEGHK